MLNPDRKTTMQSYRLPLFIVRWLRLQPESNGKLIVQALCHQHGIKQPPKFIHKSEKV